MYISPVHRVLSLVVFLKLDPNLKSLHDEPEFQAVVTEFEADMAAQLARVREMEKNGELEPIPEISATTH